MEGEDFGEGFVEDIEVEPDGPVFDVPDVEGDALGVGEVVASGDLPESGETGLDGNERGEVAGIAWSFCLDDGSGADDGHVASDDVEELREFVEAGSAKESSEGCDARVVFELDVLAPFAGGGWVVGEEA